MDGGQKETKPAEKVQRQQTLRLVPEVVDGGQKEAEPAEKVQRLQISQKVCVLSASREPPHHPQGLNLQQVSLRAEAPPAE